MTTLAVFSAIAFLMTFITQNIAIMPGYSFLTLDMKGVVIVLAGFQFGPLAAALIAVVVATIEMVTISATGPIGWLMNVIATIGFVWPAVYVFYKRRTFTSAITGLVLGMLSMTALMLLWNYIITPMYQGVPRQVIAAALLPVFLPFNLIKSGINSAVVLILYKPLLHVLGLLNTGSRKAQPVNEQRS